MNACVVLLIVTILPSPARQQALVSNLLQSCLQHFLITVRLSRKNLRQKNFCRINFQSRRRNPTPTYKTKKTSKEEEEEKTIRDWVLKFQANFFYKNTRTHTIKPLNCSYIWTDVFEKHGKTFSDDAVFNGFLGDQSRENERNEWQGEKQ